VRVKAFSPRLITLGPLGIFAGFLDAAGGGGWGPVTTSTLMAAGRMQPRMVIGTVSALSRSGRLSVIVATRPCTCQPKCFGFAIME